MGKFIVLSGPSCVGKGPLVNAFRRIYPPVASGWSSIVLFNSRDPRPGETDGVDYHYRSRSFIESLKNDPDYKVFTVRGDIQALCIPEIYRIAGESDLFFEGNPFVGVALIDIAMSLKISLLSIFLSPLSRQEILFLKERSVLLPHLIEDMMRRKLLRRTSNQKGALSLKDLEDIELRCKSAYSEICLASRFRYVIPNHDGEDSENWEAFYYPVGDAARSLFSFHNIVTGNPDSYAEKWEKGFLVQEEN